MQLEYHLVDVFTQNALEGNALAVFTDASDLDTSTMQRLAREMNLSETTFISPSESPPGPTRVRIFTPTYEMEFAGHPTIGTAAVMRRIGMVGQDVTTFSLHENVGEVPVRIGSDDLIWLTTPPIKHLDTYGADACANALSLHRDDLLDVPCELLSAGNPNIFVAVRDAATVDRVELNVPRYLEMVQSRSGATCMFVFAPTATGAYSRMFSPQLGIIEDPATGSATGPLASFMMRHGLVDSAGGTRFVSEQGARMGRRSLLHVLVNGNSGSTSIEVGGHVTHVAVARMDLPAPAVLAAR